MEIKTVKVTELGIDKDTQLKVPTEASKTAEKGLKARLVFDTASGEKSTPIELLGWKIGIKGRHKLVIQVAPVAVK